MKLYYYKDPIGNFGDDLNPWLWSRLAPELFDDYDDDLMFVGIGTLINDWLPYSPRKVVFSSGVGYLEGPLPLIDESWKIYCVRGPLSAQTLGLRDDMAITDGAALVRTINIPKEPKLYSASFMPHHRHCNMINWSLLCKTVRINYINPSTGVDDILRDIQRSKVVIAEAMHAAVVADALRIPWIPVKFYNHVLDFKWQDWCLSVGLKYKPVIPPPILRAKYAFRSARRLQYALLVLVLKWLTLNVPPTLSANSIIESVTGRLQERLEQLKSDYLRRC